MNGVDRSVDAFNQDVLERGGYVYTANAALSARIATQRHKDVLVQLGSFTGCRVLDMGCGDGFHARYFWDQTKPSAMTGVDAAPQAIEAANANKGDRPIDFVVGDIHRLPFPEVSFDVALLQGVLHHDDFPEQIIAEAFRLASKVVILEPNGYNVALKVIEKVSKYHREHGEKSYFPPKVTRWIERAGGEVIARRFAGLVPMFCPDWMARGLKFVEPAVENVPLVNALGCAIIVLVAQREGPRTPK